MGDIQLIENYENTLLKGYELLNTSTRLQQSFCTFSNELSTFPQQNLEEAKTLFYDVNEQIQQYNEQYNILLKELGILCPDEPQGDEAKVFFKALLDLFKLALTPFRNDPEGLQIYYTNLAQIVQLMETGKWSLPKEQNISNALLFQMTTSAWYLTKNPKPIQQVAKQMGGRLKRKQGGTRKRRH